MKAKQVRSAQRRRSQIARTFKLMQRDDFDVSSFLDSSPRCLERVTVYDVVRRLPHMGRDGANKCLRKAGVWPTNRWGTLSQDDREAIYAALPPRAKSVV